MFSFLRDEPDTRGRFTRREWLRIGGLGALAATAGTTQAAGDASTKPGFGRAKSVLVIFASGGQSHIDMWDPKPDAPKEIRGAFDTIKTAVPGTLFGEHMPRVAKVADKFTVVRSMSHEDLDHGSAVYLSFTGRYHKRKSSNPPARPTDFPSQSAVLKRIRRKADGKSIATAAHINAPAIVAPNTIAPGQFGGFLGREYDALTVGDVTQGRVVIPGLTPRDDLTQVRMRRRRSLLASIESHCKKLERHRGPADLDTLYDRAYRMLADPKTKNAFDLSRESDKLRDRYGRNRSGQACLLGRRLVEAGVPLVTVVWNHLSRGQDLHPNETDFYGWDTHNDVFSALKNRLLPRFDLSFSALLEDLDARGLLKTTLVVCLGEFGRAPLVALEKRFKGSSPGRKHWASAYSVVFAGAGVQRGKILGGSDRIGGYPVTQAYGPWDINATIFHALGINPSGHFRDNLSRPFAISDGKPITGLYAG